MIRNIDNTEIIGISTCGTYPSWIDYTVASFYNSVDRVVVINSGYDVYAPESGPIHRLEREHNLLERIDVDNKIIEYTLTQQDFDRLFTTVCKYGKDECGRAGNITFATKIATNLPINIDKNLKSKRRWIIKLDSDQILYQISRNQLINLTVQYPNKTGFRFAQYADYNYDFEHISGRGLPDEFTNDGAMFYKSLPNQMYGAQGSPGTHVDQKEIYDIRTSHMRRISPSDVDKYEYFFKRFWYHTFGPNTIGEHPYNRTSGKKLTLDEISKIAHDNTLEIIKQPGFYIYDLPKDERIPYTPPLVCTMTPLEYIKKGY